MLKKIFFIKKYLSLDAKLLQGLHVAKLYALSVAVIIGSVVLIMGILKLKYYWFH